MHKKKGRTAKRATELMHHDDYRTKVAVRDALGLTDRQREIYDLRVLRGWKLYDISAELDVSYSVACKESMEITAKIQRYFDSPIR